MREYDIESVVAEDKQALNGLRIGEDAGEKGE